MKNLLMTILVLLTFAIVGPVMAKEYPEFGGRCTMGVAMGTEVETDCSVNWVGPNGNLYCFGNEQAKKDFLENEQENLDKAFRKYDQVVKS
ncbi:hypothetical protein J2T55_000952 [Methylohalomonas lacus]|uniref:Uncharacterized protein n=1 Tax=Methylohalomonas lacus TaxID=398773 RepID=A0AAE3HIH9_9GAMM|nr:hypothetical protein [Methylohalomonas lacus]MCS3902944.1 hypothetical protein [Methylohalomonas lacus]